MKKFLQKCLLLVIFIGGSQVFAWQMVYHADANGNKIAGDFDTLKNAIENGHKIKVIETYSIGLASYELDFVTILNGKVYGQYTKLIAQEFDTSDTDYLKFKDYRLLLLFNSTGKVARSRWEIGAHTNLGQDSYTTELKWFID